MDALDRYHRAATSLAISVDVDRRLKDDPQYPADRSPAAYRARAETFERDLAEFRAAAVALDGH